MSVASEGETDRSEVARLEDVRPGNASVGWRTALASGERFQTQIREHVPRMRDSLRGYFAEPGRAWWPSLRLGSWFAIVESLAVRAFRRTLARLLNLILRVAATAGVALVLGLGSAWYVVDVGTGLTAESYGPWRTWPAAGRIDADPYTRAHFARLGWIPLSSTEAATYVANVDSEGRRLFADCEYEISGPIPDAPWWSLSVFNPRGAILDVPADRHYVTRNSVVAEASGRMVVRLATDTRPGNWLPTLGGSALVLVMRLHGGATVPNAVAATAPPLPEIKRVACR